MIGAYEKALIRPWGFQPGQDGNNGWVWWERMPNKETDVVFVVYPFESKEKTRVLVNGTLLDRDQYKIRNGDYENYLRILVPVQPDDKIRIEYEVRELRTTTEPFNPPGAYRGDDDEQLGDKPCPRR